MEETKLAADKPRVTMRLSKRVSDALAVAAADCEQSSAALSRDVITGWLTREGYLG